jgi:DNA topoisomerase IB
VTVTELVRSDPGAAGIRRRRCGRGFRYLDARSAPISDSETLARIKALVIPPAWEDVWICPDPDGHIQAVGTDAAGRRQYRYHDRWREQRDREKHDRMLRSLKRRRSGGDELLAYRCGSRWRDIAAGDINDYLREISGGEFTAKDFRTWHATVLAAVGLAVSRAATTAAARKRAVARVVREVADYLGNTPAVARASYIDPRVIELYEQGTTIERTLSDLARDREVGELATRGPAERAVLAMLRRCAKAA